MLADEHVHPARRGHLAASLTCPVADHNVTRPNSSENFVVAPGDRLELGAPGGGLAASAATPPLCGGSNGCASYAFENGKPR